MNLHAIASQKTAIVVPMLDITLRKNIGYVTHQDGSRQPLFNDYTGKAQIQALPTDQLTYLDSQGIQGTLKKVYLFGDWHGIDKSTQTGGDLLIFDGFEWLIVQVQEAWVGWCSVIVTRQNAIN